MGGKEAQGIMVVSPKPRQGEKMAPRTLRIQGAREHNLQGIDLEIPRDSLVTFCGVSGSGKSSLVFDTIFQEGQRRFLESLSAYARQFLGNLKRPDVERIEGLSPTVAIDQRTSQGSRRSTVGTLTGIHDLLRLLFARLGEPHCPECGASIQALPPKWITERLLEEASRKARNRKKPPLLLVLAPLVQGRKGEFRSLLEGLRMKGYVRARVDGEIRRLDEEIRLERYKAHHIQAVVDRLRPGPEKASRLAEAVEGALSLSEGWVQALWEDGTEETLSSRAACPAGHGSLPELEPPLFSFNSPQGACPTCQGLGEILLFTEESLVRHPERSLLEGALACTTRFGSLGCRGLRPEDFWVVAERFGFDLRKPWKDLTKTQRKLILEGARGEERELGRPFRGVADWLERCLRRGKNPSLKGLRARLPCPDCGGHRLRPEALAVTFRGLTIAHVSAFTVKEARDFFRALSLRGREAKVGRDLFREIRSRLEFLLAVGVPYLTLDRRADSLSSGEGQRLRIAAQLGSGLRGVTYVLDEPSIGLHPRDQERLVRSLLDLRDKGNTVLVVEHDEATMRASDHLVEIGPGPGRAGGRVTARGTAAQVARTEGSPTGAFLAGRERIDPPRIRRSGNGKTLKLTGPRLHNLKGMTVEIPLERFVCVTGVSGSGKSSLVLATLVPALRKILHGAREKAGPYESLEGVEHLDHLVRIDAAPIGRTPRSNPATYTGAFTPIRELFAATEDARVRGYTKSRFSFNLPGGRCEACGGAGVKLVEMHFLPPVEVPCGECGGKRFNEETLEIRFKGITIRDVLEMEVDQALEAFRNFPRVARPLQALHDVGLGYIKLGQPATTFSGGEAQRVKLAAELCAPATGRTLYVLDEPTTGLHFKDVKVLLSALDRLVEGGNTVLVIEHNLDVVRHADHVIDLGPGGGEEGGRVVCAGTPEEVAACPESWTGKALAGRIRPRARPRRPGPEGREGEEETPGLLRVRGARKNNLKEIDLDLPLEKLIVVTGLSGSGKTSLVFETLFTEGQRRFVESLSTYARRFLGRLEPAPVEKIDGLGPAIAVGNGAISRNPRSTVATSTEIHDYLRLLYARGGRAFCPDHGLEMRALGPGAMARQAIEKFPGLPAWVLAPQGAPRAAKRESFRKRWLEEGFVRALAGGKEVRLDGGKIPARGELALVVDRVKLTPGNRARIAEAAEQAAREGKGRVEFRTRAGQRLILTTGRSCPECGFSIPLEVNPRLFSFNHHEGACPECHGLGVKLACAPERLVGDPSKPLLEGGFTHPELRRLFRRGSWPRIVLEKAAAAKGVDLDRPFREIPPSRRRWILEGTGGKSWVGVARLVDHFLAKAAGEEGAEGTALADLLDPRPCPACGGTRINPVARNFKVGEYTLPGFLSLQVEEALEALEGLSFPPEKAKILSEPLKEVRNRLEFLSGVGLGYISLDRPMGTLSRGEARRIRLATQLGNKLTGVLYTLDEPTVGLHPRDADRLLGRLRELRDLGNTLVVVEHDEGFIRAADHLVDLGPGAGRLGGRVVAQGPPALVAASRESATARWLRGEASLPLPEKRRKGNGSFLRVKGAETHNLKGIDVSFPLGTFTVVTGVSGAGKSSLVLETLLPALRGEKVKGEVLGKEAIQRVRVVEAGPIGSSPSSNPATFTGIFNDIRALFASTEAARMKGYTPRRFSPNVPGGRCEACSGRGFVKVQMHFLPDVWLKCEVCGGKRFEPETLQVTWRGKNIAEILEMEVSQAAALFASHPRIHKVLLLLEEVGLGYLQLGQPSHTLSGGEAQRLRLAAELAGPAPAGTLYLLDEPTTGLHLEDTARLLGVLHRLVDRGGTVIVIEHHPGVIRSADYVIDLGPEAAGGGGEVVARGTPEEVARCPASRTGRYLGLREGARAAGGGEP